MTKQEMMTSFKEHFADEVGDIETYLNLSEAAEAIGEDEAAEMLAMIANDEQTHAHDLKEIVMEMGGECSEEALAKYHAAEKRLEHRLHGM